MRAARFYNKGDIRVEEIPAPSLGPNQVIVDIEWGGICGSDLHEYLVGPLVINPPERPHSLTGEHIPVTLGHEFCGRISQVSAEAGENGWKVGDAVMVDPRLNCQKCEVCLRGDDNVCSKWGFLGLNGGGGGGAGFAEKCAVQSRMCYLLPESVKLENAALIEPLAVGRHALNNSGFEDFSKLNILVVGGGPVGLSVLHNLRAKGAGKLYVSEPTAKRQQQTREFADEVFNPLITNVAEECRAKTNGAGVDLVFDCAGIPAGLKNGMDALRIKGTYVNVAGWEQPVGPIHHAIVLITDSGRW